MKFHKILQIIFKFFINYSKYFANLLKEFSKFSQKFIPRLKISWIYYNFLKIYEPFSLNAACKQFFFKFLNIQLNFFWNFIKLTQNLHAVSEYFPKKFLRISSKSTRNFLQASFTSFNLFLN